MKIVVEKAQGKRGWVVKATIDGVSRYRTYYYKKDAKRSIEVEWSEHVTMRDFYHNFFSSKELGLTIQTDDCTKESY